MYLDCGHDNGLRNCADTVSVVRLTSSLRLQIGNVRNWRSIRPLC